MHYIHFMWTLKLAKIQKCPKMVEHIVSTVKIGLGMNRASFDVPIMTNV